jgi:FkbM family methyltransferase
MVLTALSCGGGRTASPAPAPGADAGAAIAPGPPQAAAAPTASITCATRGPFGGPSDYYSQFYEDYILSYVFRDVKNGVYVDVGANDPNDSSVTKHFYLAGWRGINIEPNPELRPLLDKARPEDVNLSVGISDKPGFLTFYRFTRFSGLSTFDRAIALRHRKAGVEFQEVRIPVTTLNEALKHDIVKNGITFMNVDVEGFEKQVFTGIDFSQHPVTVVMAEATAPETEIPTHQIWEPILFKAGYLFAMDDGLNRYYVHPAHRDLLPRFVEVNYCVGMDKIAKGIKLDAFTQAGH